MTIRIHRDNPELFREAIAFTAAETGFNQRLIEKDYYCSVLLKDLAALDSQLVFKGGTLLAKIHAGFYRLSEDLDFSISTGPTATKNTRSKSVAPIKSAIEQLPRRLAGFQVDSPLTGSNASTQYNAVVSYRSVLADQRETIRIEIGLREETMTDLHAGMARTLLLDPIRRTDLIPEFGIPSLSYLETMAEKLRAALCRREVAIRDFYDVDHAVRNAGLNPLDRPLLDLVRRKLCVIGTGALDVSQRRRDQLTAQLQAQLRPVLRSTDFVTFDLSRAFDNVVRVADSVR